MIATRDFLGVHEELRRLILRRRWERWYLRLDHDLSHAKFARLSGRLSRVAPMYDERHFDDWEDFDS